MHDFWTIYGWTILVLIGIIQLNVSCVWSLNDEGTALLKFKERVVNDPFEALTNWDEKNGENCPCSWFGIQCADGHVISLNLENLCLEGTLAPELQYLSHIKSIILRNNSFSGTIPKELGVLKELKLLNLAYNNLRRPLPNEFQYNIPALLLDSNGQSCYISPEFGKLTMLADTHGDKNSLTGNIKISPDTRQDGEKKYTRRSRMLLDNAPGSDSLVSPTTIVVNNSPPEDPGRPSPNNVPPPKPPPSPSPNNVPPPKPPPSDQSSPPSEGNEKTRPPTSPILQEPPSPPTVLHPPPSPTGSSNSSKKSIIIAVVVVVGFIGLALAVGLYFLRGNKMRKTGDSPRGLTGQLQRAFVAGVQNLRRAELVTACEDFSNVIGTCSIGTIYKGTLSNGVEIAVISLAASSANAWSRNLESLFRKKIETLSTVHHKNFINLIGYCEEEEPFTRMMVFEYAPNGSLFEHLHVREAEHLDWGMRMRIATGLAYCLEHMHQLTPPITHPNLNSASVHLSEDYASKLSDFCLWNEVAALQVQPIDLANLQTSSTTLESNVYNFGLVVLEMMTGRIPHTAAGNEAIDEWMSEFLNGEKSLKELIDPMLRRYKVEQLENISELIKNCLESDPQMRPTMTDVCESIKGITKMDQDRAGPRLSPLWWSELESRGSANSGSVGSAN